MYYFYVTGKCQMEILEGGRQNSQSLKQIGVATSERFRGTFVHFIVGFKLYQILHTLYLKINGYTLKI
jgi:hypothetical protein